MVDNKSFKPGYATLAAIILALGVSGLLGLNLLWPVVFILLPGLVMLLLAVMGGGVGTLIFAVPGALVAGTGALMFLQNITGYWESWAYAWTLYGAFLGLAFAMMGRSIHEPGLIRVGRWFVHSSIAAFALFGALFELLIFQTGGSLIPLLLVATGLYLTLRSQTDQDAHTRLGDKIKQKVKAKPKREDKLFVGPVVYGSTVRKREGAQVAVMDMDDIPDQRV